MVSPHVSASASTASTVWSLIQALLTQLTLDRLMLGMMLVVIFAAAACTRMQSDSWWQLGFGEQLSVIEIVWGMRPHMISLLLASAILLIQWRRFHWMLPPLFLLWANLQRRLPPR